MQLYLCVDGWIWIVAPFFIICVIITLVVIMMIIIQIIKRNRSTDEVKETMILNKTTTDTNNPHYVIFVSFSNHSLSFISHYSTIFYYHLFIPIQYYWIQSREYHSHHSLLISFISYFHLYLHSHIISILFISHNSCQSLSHSVPITSICYHFINSHPFISSSLIVSYDCCWL